MGSDVDAVGEIAISVADSVKGDLQLIGAWDIPDTGNRRPDRRHAE